MKTIKLWFTDFYEGFNPKDNYLFNLISDHYLIELNTTNPDFLIYSCYGNNFLNYNCVRIYYTGENLRPDFNLCDYAIGFDHMEFGERYLRYPNYAFIEDQFLQLVRPKKQNLKPHKDHFCNFIYANSKADPIRDRFYYLLNKYKKVSSPGKHLNNISMDVGERFSEDWMYSKLNFQERCKFSIVFENTSSPGYTTEKLMHAFITGTIPIYWGNPKVSLDFNPNAFINCHDFNNLETVVQRVKEVDQDDELFDRIIQEPPFRNNKIPYHLRKEHLTIFLKNILNKDPKDAVLRPSYGTTHKYENNLKYLILIKIKYEKFQPYLKFLKSFKL